MQPFRSPQTLVRSPNWSAEDMGNTTAILRSASAAAWKSLKTLREAASQQKRKVDRTDDSPNSREHEPKYVDGMNTPDRMCQQNQET